ncbi:MAG: peptide chain release factor N(5)-glutamine methyltransferase, partial [Puniceicoccales bacterium]|nr:peptide chain release factor N(5)-glutamine methyltransferase [Puniceicoccales bacterium]
NCNYRVVYAHPRACHGGDIFKLHIFRNGQAYYSQPQGKNIKMPALIDILKKSEEFLRKKNISNPRFEAECILTKVLECKRIDLYLRYMEKLSVEQLNDIKILLTRRANHEPLQYIIGKWPFHDLTLNLDSCALIPRPETEELVEILIKKFSQYKNARLSILDLGTGSGAIALSLARFFQKSHTCASDYSSETLSLARENAAANSIQSITFAKSDWFSNIFGSFDLIASNPPYLSEEEWEQCQPEIKFFEPKLALCAGDGGKADLLKIIDQSPRFLKANGVLALETGETQHQAVFEFAKENFQLAESIRDSSQRNRFIVLSRPKTKIV